MNIPNALTIIRLLMIPGFVYYYLSFTGYGNLTAVIFLVAAGITDILDGFIARRYNLVTRLGTVLDPLADKLMLLTVLLSITVKNQMSFRIIAIVAIKEILIILGAVTLFNENDIVMPANRYGKISTVMFYAAAIAVSFGMPYGGAMLEVFVMVTIMSLVVYANAYINIRRRHMNPIKK